MCRLLCVWFRRLWNRCKNGNTLLIPMNKGMTAAFVILEGPSNLFWGTSEMGWEKRGMVFKPSLGYFGHSSFHSQEKRTTIDVIFPSVPHYSSVFFLLCSHAWKGLCPAWFSFLQIYGISSSSCCKWLKERELRSLQQHTASRLIGQCDAVLHCMHVV